MKRAAFLTLVIIILLAGYFYSAGLLSFVPANNTTLDVFQILYGDAAAIALLILVVVLLAFLIYFRDISRAFKDLQRAGERRPIASENYAEVNLAQRFEFTERALHEFAAAMEIYAEHMASHTSAIRGLSEASHALKGSAAEQNRILVRLSKSITRDSMSYETTVIEKLVNQFETKATAALLARDFLEIGIKDYIIDEIPVKKETKSPPPGCVVKSRAFAARKG